jgi:hypothetical protein
LAIALASSSGEADPPSLAQDSNPVTLGLLYPASGDTSQLEFIIEVLIRAGITDPGYNADAKGGCLL